MKTVKVALVVLIFSLLLSCSMNKFEGTKQPELAKQACPIAQNRCAFFAEIDDRIVAGYYSLEESGKGNYQLKGSVKLDLAKVAPIIRSISSLRLKFVFLNQSMVVVEETISVSGKVGAFIEFSELVEIDGVIDKSNIATVGWRASELGSY